MGHREVPDETSIRRKIYGQLVSCPFDCPSVRRGVKRIDSCYKGSPIAYCETYWKIKRPTNLPVSKLPLAVVLLLFTTITSHKRRSIRHLDFSTDLLDSPRAIFGALSQLLTLLPEGAAGLIYELNACNAFAPLFAHCFFTVFVLSLVRLWRTTEGRRCDGRMTAVRTDFGLRRSDAKRTSLWKMDRRRGSQSVARSRRRAKDRAIPSRKTQVFLFQTGSKQ